MEMLKKEKVSPPVRFYGIGEWSKEIHVRDERGTGLSV
jgi:hypothetical protein